MPESIDQLKSAIRGEIVKRLLVNGGQIGKRAHAVFSYVFVRDFLGEFGESGAALQRVERPSIKGIVSG